MKTRAPLPAIGDARRPAEQWSPRTPSAAPGDARGLSFVGDGALDDFPAESDVRSGKWKPPGEKSWRRRPWTVLAVAALVVAVGVAVAWPRRTARPTPAAQPAVERPAPLERSAVPVAATGTLAIETTPPGATVAVDGAERGSTPLSLALAPGTYSVTVSKDGDSRVLSARVTAGGEVVHHFELKGLPPREAPFVAVRPEQVPTASPGWVTVVTPVELQVFENGALIGTSSAERVLLLAGRHTLKLVNAELDFEVWRTVTIAAGRVATVLVQVPNGALFVNAVPWAEVLLDGRRIGDTPIANFPAPIGAHEITLRNPKFAEQRRTVVIPFSAPARVGVDLRQ